jgi:hypothetical protein
MDVRHVADLYPMVGNYKVTIGFVWWKTKRNTFIFSLIQQNADTSSIYSLFLSQPLPPLSISSSGGVLQPSPSVSVSSSPHLPTNQLFSLLPLLNIFNQLNEIGLVIINKNSSRWMAVMGWPEMERGGGGGVGGESVRGRGWPPWVK